MGKRNHRRRNSNRFPAWGLGAARAALVGAAMVALVRGDLSSFTAALVALVASGSVK